VYVGINGTLNVSRVLLPVLGGAVVLTAGAMGAAFLLLGYTPRPAGTAG
jgi:hypothetical protein